MFAALEDDQSIMGSVMGDNESVMGSVMGDNESIVGSVMGDGEDDASLDEVSDSILRQRLRSYVADLRAGKNPRAINMVMKGSVPEMYRALVFRYERYPPPWCD